MSSESISPASFYSSRGFGYKRFEKVKPNILDNRIILYEKYPIFNINDHELENYPMILEIATKTVNEDVIREQNGFFFADETIYLNPFTTKILFRNEQERLSTLSNSEPSIETKMVSLYRNCFLIRRGDIESFDWIISDIEDSKNDIFNYISKDRKINKLKGLLYAYLIAANKTVSPNVVSLKKYVKNLRNILSAIITSPDGRATYKQEEQLNSIYKLINDKFQSIFLEPVLKEKSEKYHCEFLEILKQENLFDSWLRQNNFLKYHILQFYVPANDKDRAFDSYMQNIEDIIMNIEISQGKSKTDISYLPVFQHYKISKIADQKEFLTKLLNEYLEEAYNSEDFILSRYEFAKTGGKIFKEEMQDKWEGSQLQLYINALLKNLNEYSSFDIKSAKNLTLESFAAFCQKGESDIDKLEDFLISNEIGDFRIAFGLWGIIFGFANMPKTLTNDLFMSEDLDYISRAYKYIFKQVHGIELEGEIEKAQKLKQPIIQNPPLKTLQAPIEAKEVTKNISKNQDILEKLKECNLNDKQLNSISELYEENHFILNEAFFILIKKIRGVGNKIKEIKNALGYNNTQSIKSIRQEPLSLFGVIKPKLGKEFYKDSNIWIYIEELLPNDKKICKQIKTDLDWFQCNYQETYFDPKKGNQKGYYFDKQKDNLSVLENYKKYLENKKNQKDVEKDGKITSMKWIRDIYNKIDIDKIISKLKEFYRENER